MIAVAPPPHCQDVGDLCIAPAYTSVYHLGHMMTVLPDTRHEQQSEVSAAKLRAQIYESPDDVIRGATTEGLAHVDVPGHRVFYAKICKVRTSCLYLWGDGRQDSDPQSVSLVSIAIDAVDEDALARAESHAWAPIGGVQGRRDAYVSLSTMTVRASAGFEPDYCHGGPDREPQPGCADLPRWKRQRDARKAIEGTQEKHP